ncbi:MAG: hypothetical protein GYA24_18145, partial [Candidatus Lokiarchaeota archaeon]|nr:hypothetical protein [Candidatus Lokiarchaeota archaeon]
MAKISMAVAIRGPKDMYRPGDVFEGEITLVNNDRDKDGKIKPVKVKSVQVVFFEHVPVASNEIGKVTYFLDESHEEVSGKIIGKPIEGDAWTGRELHDVPVRLPFSV